GKRTFLTEDIAALGLGKVRFPITATPPPRTWETNFRLGSAANSLRKLGLICVTMGGAFLPPYGDCSAMKIASVAEVKSQFSAFLKASEGEPVVVTRNGRPVAVIVGVQDGDEIERLLMACSPHLQAILERSRRQFREGQWLSEGEFWSQFERSPPSKGSAKPKKRAAPDGRGATNR